MLATTRSYLMVVKTAYKDKGSGKELCGFTSRMGGSAPTPRLLRLKAEVVALTVRCACCAARAVPHALAAARAP